jgi:NitT/TauT family transport system permease protein
MRHRGPDSLVRHSLSEGGSFSQRGMAGPWPVAAGRIAVAFAVLAAWKMSANLAGPLYVADPLPVLQRIVDSTISGVMTHHVLATLRVTALGFAGGCSVGVALPLLLYPVPRLTTALEPYIGASAGIPKYAVVPLLILWFGIDDAPKLWLVGLLVFYPVFIGVIAGMRHVDPELVHMVHVLGAGSFTAARLVVWYSMLPFFFAALKIAVPRGVSAAITGELLVGEEGIGYLIESARQNADTVGVFAGLTVATTMVMAATVIVGRIQSAVAGASYE